MLTTCSFIMYRHTLGASMESIQLLSKYLEITSDVQSCTLIAIRTFPSKLLQENQVQVWITRYCNQIINFNSSTNYKSTTLT